MLLVSLNRDDPKTVNISSLTWKIFWLHIAEAGKTRCICMLQLIPNVRFIQVTFINSHERAVFPVLEDV